MLPEKELYEDSRRRKDIVYTLGRPIELFDSYVSVKVNQGMLIHFSSLLTQDIAQHHQLPTDSITRIQ
jgi:hypothetical protein